MLNLTGVPQSLTSELRSAALDAGISRLALVGGVVRDLLIHQLHDVSLADVKDFDWVVEGSAISLAEALLKRCGSQRVTDIKQYGIYGTVSLCFDGILVDLATARQEIYPAPALNPLVKFGSLEQDLSRRDFSINAMAVDLMSGELVDFHLGWHSLLKKQLVLLHENSVRDDPTRIIRAARYSARLGFNLDQRTELQVTETIKTWPWHWSLDDPLKQAPPALSSRLGMELERLFQDGPWIQAVSYLKDWHAFTLIDMRLQEDSRLIRRLYWAKRLGLPLLPSLLSGANDPHLVSRRLQLPGYQQIWLSQLADLKNWLSLDAPELSSPPSVWTEAIEKLGMKGESIALMICLMPYQWRPLLRWWLHWRHVKSPRSARQLLDSGWLPGPLLGKELKRLRNDELDKI